MQKLQSLSLSLLSVGQHLLGQLALGVTLLMQVPKRDKREQAEIKNRSAAVRAKLADRMADKSLAEAHGRTDAVKEVVSRLRDVRTRNHLGEMVHKSLANGGSNVANG